MNGLVIFQNIFIYGEHNYSLGILEEGFYWLSIYINGELEGIDSFNVSRIFTTYVPTTYTTIETYIGPYIVRSNGKYFEVTTTIIETRVEFSKLITTTIKVKEKSETTNLLTTKTIQESSFKEIKKEEIDSSIFSLFLFIIVILFTFSLHVIFKRGGHV